jgi:tripartite-type tricarboxylate transporter receptor subunit TctC
MTPNGAWPDALEHSRMRNALAFAVLVASGVTASAQTYPSRSITMVVPFAAGGAFDVLGRVLAVRMSEILDQQVIVENPSGGGGTVGVLRVVNAAPDGYTFLLGSIGTHAYNPTVYKNLRYNAASDFSPVALVADQPMVLIVRKDFPASTLQEFIAYVKANSAKLQYGSAGVGSTTHLSCTLLNAAISANVVHVPYRGGGPAAQAVVAGQMDYACLNIGGAVPLITGNAVKGIATLTRARASSLPDLPTAHEQGLTDFDVSTWNAFFLPKNSPGGVIKKLNDATSATLDTPAIRTRLQDLGVIPAAPDRRSPEYLAQFVKDEIERWAGPIRASGIQGD